MENNKNTLDSILSFLGILSLLVIVHNVYKKLDTNTETNVISDNALKAIKNPETADKLRKEVDNYHITGKWNESKLESIL